MIYDFVLGLWKESACYDQPITLEDAAKDLENFRNDGWWLPPGITPEAYMEIWNGLVERRCQE